MGYGISTAAGPTPGAQGKGGIGRRGGCSSQGITWVGHLLEALKLGSAGNQSVMGDAHSHGPTAEMVSFLAPPLHQAPGMVLITVLPLKKGQAK